MNRMFAALGGLSLLLLTVSADEAQACSVCLAGDPLFSMDGTTVQEKGDFSVYIQVQGWRKESGLLPHEEEEEEHGHEEEEEEGNEKNASQRADLFLSWAPLDRFTVTLDIPFAFNEIEEIEGDTSETFHMSGLGDISVAGSFVLWRNRDVLPSTWIEARALLKTPTGRSRRREGGVIDPHLQAGTDSWDYGGGLAFNHRFSWGSAYASIFYRENGEGDFGDLDYEYGDFALANAGVEVPLGHAFGCSKLEWLTIGSELNYRYAKADRADGERFDDSGGSVLYVTPSVRAHLPFALGNRKPSLRLAVQLPVTSSWLNGDQDEKEVWSVGLLFPF